jgi:hypothetical protein
MKTRLARLLFLIIPLRLFGQSDSVYSKKYPSNVLLQDFDFLVSALSKTHPALIWQKQPYSFINNAAYLKKQIAQSDSLTENEFLSFAAKLNSAIQCAHTNISPSDAYDSWWKKEALLLPFNIIWARGNYYIYQNYSPDTTLSFGTQILAINGMPIKDIISKLFYYIPADGMNRTKKFFALRASFYRYYSYYIQQSSPTYTITYKKTEGEEKDSLVVAGISKDQLNTARDKLNNQKDNRPINAKSIDSLNTVVLSIPTFREDLFNDAGISFTNYLDAFFARLKTDSTQNLVIDLRDNGGGLSEYGAVLLSYLTDTAFVYCKNMWLANNTLFDFIEYDVPKTFEGFPQGIVKENGRYKWTKHSVLGWRQPAKNNFKGKVYVIINGGCSSTTAEIISLLKTQKQAVLIGEEMGGKYKGNNSGITGHITLPNTKITAKIAMVEYELAVDEENNQDFVFPDFLVWPTINDIKTGLDAEMDFTLNLIKDQK